MPSAPPRRRHHHHHGRRRARLLLLLLPALALLLLVLLSGPAGRAHASPAPEDNKERTPAREHEVEEAEGDRGLEDVDDVGEPTSSSGSSGGDGGGHRKGKGRPTFNFLEVRTRAELEAEGFQCFPTGECLECTQEEMAQPFCTATQRREEVTCEIEETVRSGVEAQKKVRAVTTYETCYATAGDDMTSMLRFQALMAVLGGLALYGVRHQKLKHQTLYERRQVGGRTRRRGGYSGI